MDDGSKEVGGGRTVLGNVDHAEFEVVGATFLMGHTIQVDHPDA